MRPEIITVLDVGTTKVCAVVAEADRDRVHIRGAGVTASAGLRKGIVIDIDAASAAVRQAVKEAETSSGSRIRSVTVSISGGHVQGLTSSGATGLRGCEVTPSDVERAIDSAKVVYIPLNREILGVVPSGFVLDGQAGILNPVGMTGVRLEARVHIITAAVSRMKNLLACCEKAGVEVDEPVCDVLAAAQAVLTTEEKESGVVLVDIGGGTTGVALFREGSLRHMSVLDVGGNHVTSDISLGLRLNISEAERLKKAFGCAFGGALNDEEEMSVCSPDGQVRGMPRKYLTEVVQPRCEEMLALIREEITACHAAGVNSVVLTGGASLLRGFDRMAESSLGLPVRIGAPGNMYGCRAAVQGPAFASVIGLVLCRVRAGSGCELPADAFSRMKERFRNVFRHKELLHLINKKEGGMVCLKSRK